MIEFNRFSLDNGLRLLVHTDTNTPMVAINVLYDVGSKDEDPGHTGFAHLFEHLMFGGSLNIESYDRELEKVGGENNAFTTSDYTNYYLQVPASNVETGFRLESDRMLSLAFSEKKLDVQRNVVMEEFKQGYLNKPYGDLWLELKPLAYTQHPYRWPAIGSDIEHIARATLEEVKAFYGRYYHPANAVLSVAGNITGNEALELTKKWFGDIPSGIANHRNLPVEPPQLALRTMTIFRDVPYDVAILAWKMPGRAHKDYQVCELLAELLTGGESSLLISTLVNDCELLTEVECFLSEENDHGLFCLFAKPRQMDMIYQAVETIVETLHNILKNGIRASELDKVKNKALTAIALGQLSIHNKAMSLALGELLGDANRINLEPQRYQEITMDDIMRVGSLMFQQKNCSILYYRSRNFAS